MTRAKNRHDFPQMAAVIDEIRASLSDPSSLKVLWVEENGRSMGQRPELSPAEIEISGNTYLLLHERRQLMSKRGKR
jgi:hypothetical protein